MELVVKEEWVPDLMKGLCPQDKDVVDIEEDIIRVKL